jgi:hypothetical protein
MRNIFPTWHHAPIPPPKYDQIIVADWLDHELIETGWIRPTIEQLVGWRNREVFYFVKAGSPAYFQRLAVKMYGSDQIENVKFRRQRGRKRLRSLPPAGLG